MRCRELIVCDVRHVSRMQRVICLIDIRESEKKKITLMSCRELIVLRVWDMQIVCRDSVKHVDRMQRWGMQIRCERIKELIVFRVWDMQIKCKELRHADKMWVMLCSSCYDLWYHHQYFFHILLYTVSSAAELMMSAFDWLSAIASFITFCVVNL